MTCRPISSAGRSSSSSRASNLFGAGVQDLSTCEAYPFTPLGVGVGAPIAAQLAGGVPLDLGAVERRAGARRRLRRARRRRLRRARSGVGPMTEQLQLRRGTASQVAAFTGAQGELVVDTTNNRAVVNDGATAWRMAGRQARRGDHERAHGGRRRRLCGAGRPIASSPTRRFPPRASSRSAPPSAYPTGTRLTIVDESGACSATKTITVQPRRIGHDRRRDQRRAEQRPRLSCARERRRRQVDDRRPGDEQSRRWSASARRPIRTTRFPSTAPARCSTA